MSFRKERKFRLTAYDARRLKSDLLMRGMSLLYPNRRITSQYFDNDAGRAFVESEEGSVPRKKLRIRWYHDDQSQMQWEEKTSSIEGRFKTTRALSRDAFDELMRFGHMDNLYGLCRPVMRISYERSYYRLEALRVTFDTNIQYQIHSTGRTLREFEEVVEIKAPVETPEDYLEGLVAAPASRFSKYARAFLVHESGL